MTNIKLSNNQFTLLQDYLNNNIVSHGFPNYIMIETTNSCNLDCVMCPRSVMTRKVGFMDFELFKKIIDEVQEGTEFIYLHFVGEPLMHNKLFDFIDYAAGKGMTVALSTNGFFLNETNSNSLLNSKLDMLIICVDSLEPETYDKIRVRGDFDKTMKQVDDFLEKYKQSSPSLNIALQLIRMNLNQHEVGAFKSKWETESGINVVVKNIHDFANQLPAVKSLRCDDQQIKSGNYCMENWRHLVIGWDGTVGPCCNDYDFKYPLGDININSVKEIWNSTPIQQLRKAQVEGRQSEIALCKECNIPHEDQLKGGSLLSAFNPTMLEAHEYFNKNLLYRNGELFAAREFEILVQDRFKDVTIIMSYNYPDNKTRQIKCSLFNDEVGRFDFIDELELNLKTPEKYKGRLLRYTFELIDSNDGDDKGIFNSLPFSKLRGVKQVLSNLTSKRVLSDMPDEIKIISIVNG